jgi:AraC family transcriptional regulator
MRQEPSHRNHHGEIITSRGLQGLSLSEVTYAQNLRLPRHSHEQACFCFILRGSCTESYHGKTLDCRPLHLKFRPAGESHSNHYAGTRVRCFLVEVEAAWLERAREYAAPLESPALLGGESLVRLAMRLRSEARQPDRFTPLSVEGLMLEMLAETSRKTLQVKEGARPRWLSRAREILHEQFSERVTLTRLAADVGVHPAYLAVAFRRRHQCSVGEYLRRLRIEFACRALSGTDAPLAEVALDAGFSHQSHFSRTFKRYTELTPAQYRSAFRRS